MSIGRKENTLLVSSKKIAATGETDKIVDEKSSAWTPKNVLVVYYSQCHKWASILTRSRFVEEDYRGIWCKFNCDG